MTVTTGVHTGLIHLVFSYTISIFIVQASLMQPCSENHVLIDDLSHRLQCPYSVYRCCRSDPYDRYASDYDRDPYYRSSRDGYDRGLPDRCIILEDQNFTERILHLTWVSDT